MKKIAKMMAARSAGDTWSSDPNRKMGFDMRTESARRGGEGRMNGESEMRMGGYDSPESVRRSPRTGRFIRGEYTRSMGERNGYEMNGGYGMEMRGGNNNRAMAGDYDMNRQYGAEMRSGGGSRMNANNQEKWRGGNEMSRYDEHGRPLEGRSMQSRYREYEDDEEEDDMEFNEKTADEWTTHMKNEDGSKGPHWSKEQTRAVMVQHGIVCDPVEFFAVMNSLYSDYSAVAKKYGVDRPDFYAQLAKAWLEDKDAVDDKAAVYYKYVVKKK